MQKIFIHPKKNQLMKKLFTLITAFSIGVSAFAGGLLTNTNQSVHFLRNPAQDASTDIDAAYSNPAGLIYLPDGFHFSLTNQSAFQTRRVTSTFAPFAAYGGNATKVYNAKKRAKDVKLNNFRNLKPECKEQLRLFPTDLQNLLF